MFGENLLQEDILTPPSPHERASVFIYFILWRGSVKFLQFSTIWQCTDPPPKWGKFVGELLPL